VLSFLVSPIIFENRFGLGNNRQSFMARADVQLDQLAPFVSLAVKDDLQAGIAFRQQAVFVSILDWSIYAWHGFDPYTNLERGSEASLLVQGGEATQWLAAGLSSFLGRASWSLGPFSSSLKLGLLILLHLFCLPVNRKLAHPSFMLVTVVGLPQIGHMSSRRFIPISFPSFSQPGEHQALLIVG
jgi:hypothetical protein